MPSPIGHALAGATVAWIAGGQAGRVGGATHRSHATHPSDATVLWTCVALAMAPDLDLLASYTHRTITHSLLAVAVIFSVLIVVTGKVTGRIVWRFVVAATAAYGSHLLLDWLAIDDTPPRGIQLLWPFDGRWFISGWDLFRGTARREIFTLQSARINLLAIVQETLMLGPIAWLAHRYRARSERQYV